jgi:ethanolamine utilization cobalamin adenosyltransferase
MKLTNMASILMQLNPQIASAINWYQLLADVTESLGLQKNILSETEFKKQVAAQAQQQQAMVEAQQGLAQSQMNKNNAGALKELAYGQE